MAHTYREVRKALAASLPKFTARRWADRQVIVLGGDGMTRTPHVVASLNDLAETIDPLTIDVIFVLLGQRVVPVWGAWK